MTVALPLQITWRGMEASPAVEADIRAKAEKLKQTYDHIVSLRVVVESPHAHHHKGRIYQLHIDVRVPGKEIVVTHNPGDDHAHEDLYVATRDAFDAARRRLKEYGRVRRGDVKNHSRPR